MSVFKSTIYWYLRLGDTDNICDNLSPYFIPHINLRSSGGMCPAEKQTMKLQALAVCASAVHVISADPVLNGSNTCGIPRTPNLKIRTPLILRVL